MEDVAQQLSKRILRGWKRQLRRLDHQPFFDDTEYSSTPFVGHAPHKTKVLWLHCASWTTALTRSLQFKHLHRACEGVALLNILRDLDATRWKTTVETLWPAVQDEIDVCDYLVRPPAVGIAFAIEARDHFQWLSDRVVGVEPMSPRYQSAFDDVTQALLACAQERVVSSACVPRIPVVLTTFIDDSKILGQLLQLVVTQYRVMQASSLEQPQTPKMFGESQERACIQILELDADGNGSKDIDLQGLECLCRIAEHEVRVVKLQSLNIERESKHASTNAFHILLPPETQSRRHVFGAAEVAVTDTVSSATTTSLLSAVQVCPSVTRVGLIMEQDGHDMDDNYAARRHRLWRWIAYALFSREARHKIRTLTVDARHLQEADIAEMRRVLVSTAPLEVLLRAVPCRHHKYAKASRFCIRYRHTGEQGDIVLLERDFEGICPIVVRVLECAIETESDWWCVLLPGSGKAWVHRDNIFIIPQDEWPLEAFPSFELLKFTNMVDDAKRTCLALLKALPCTFERIEITEDNDDIEVDDWYPAVLKACPGLKSLSLPNTCCIDSLKPFIELAEDGTSTLEKLAIDSRLHIHDYDLIELLTTLADMTHPLTRHLCHLELLVVSKYYDDDDDELADEDVEQAKRLDSEFVATVQTMLDHNRRLHTVKFYFKDLEIPLSPRERIAIRIAPLEISSKLALLSVIAHATSKSGPAVSAAGHLDASVLTIVFQFAAQHRMRRVVMARY